MATCDYAKSLNSAIDDANYERFHAFFEQKKILYTKLINLIELDTSTDAEIEKATQDYDNYKYSGDDPTLNIECCNAANNPKNDFFYNTNTQTCIKPSLVNGYKKYVGLSRMSDPGLTDGDTKGTESNCTKICDQNSEKCDSFQITDGKCRFYSEISNNYDIDPNSVMYVQTSEKKSDWWLIILLIFLLIVAPFIGIIITFFVMKKTVTKVMN